VQITEVRIKLMPIEEDSAERLKAFCSITFDDAFVIRDLKIIEGANGPFVAMPSRKLTSHCGNCRAKNHLRAVFCNQCGKRLPDNRVIKDEDGRARLYADIAHPINSDCREMIQTRVVQEFREEIVRSKQDGYVSRYEEYDYDGGDYDEAFSSPRAPRAARTGGRIHIQEGPQSSPPAPHMPPASPSPAREHNNRGETAQSFGAGIFE
jgi:stage V sporulation protein G